MALEDDKILYQELYMGNENTCIHYEELLNTYSTYLALFVSQVSDYSKYYMNLAYLNHVVDGFEYYQDSIFEKEDITDEDISEYILYKFEMFQQYGPMAYEDLSIQDLIFKVSGACQEEIANNGLLSFAEPIIRKMYSNAYKIEMTIDKYSNKNYKGM